MYGSETWPMKVEHELKLNRTEMSMIRWRGCLRGGVYVIVMVMEG